jgi:uncharacterized protein YgiB involved in biofilm formation
MTNRTTLSAALLAGVATFCLTGCEKPKEIAVKVYANIDECKVDHPIDECTKAFEGAQREQAVSAPHIPTREECIAKYGVDACVPHHDSSGDWFGPAMAGFMIGHMMGSTAPVYQPVYIYHGSAYSGGTALGSYRPGGYVSVPPSSSWTKSYNTTIIQQTSKGGYAPVTRGGFGGAASAISRPSAPSSSSWVGKASPSVPSSIASPGVSSARGGFGGAAAGASAGG